MRAMSKIPEVNSRFTNNNDYYSTEYICQSKHFTTALGDQGVEGHYYTTTVTLQ
jgi:hypothetical protein